LAHGVRPELEKLEVTLELCAIGLRKVVGPIVHHAVLQSSVKENVSTDAVNPILFPAFERGVVNVIAFARVGTVEALPVFLNHTILQDEFYFAVSRRDRPLSCAHVPFAEPKIKLAVL